METREFVWKVTMCSTDSGEMCLLVLRRSWRHIPSYGVIKWHLAQVGWTRRSFARVQNQSVPDMSKKSKDRLRDLHCNLQRGITQPILWLFWHICTYSSRSYLLIWKLSESFSWPYFSEKTFHPTSKERVVTMTFSIVMLWFLPLLGFCEWHVDNMPLLVYRYAGKYMG